MNAHFRMIRFFFAVGLFSLCVARSESAELLRPSDKSIPLTDPNIFLSPYCWRIDATGSAICPAAGGYLKFKVTGTSKITLQVSTTINQGLLAVQMPSVKVVVNGPTLDGLARYYQFPPNNSDNTPVTVATELDPKLHYQVLVQVTGADELAMSGWSGTIFQTQINQLVVDAGASLLPTSLRPKRALFLGASYEQAYFGMLKPHAPVRLDAPIYTYVDASLSWPFFVAYGLDCEYGQIGIGGQGWVHHGAGGYPAFTASWDHFDQANVKAFFHDLDYVFVHFAENDAAEDNDAVQSAVTSWIPAARAAFGNKTKIFIILSLPQIKSGPIKAGVRAAADPLTCLLDPGTEYQHVVFSGGPTWASPGDGIHPDAIHQSIFTAFVIRQAQAYLDGAREKVPD
jgi:hypothetical protein